MRSLLKTGLALVVLVAAVGSVGVGLAWRHNSQKLATRRAEFFERYEAAMEDSIQSHYFMLEELPTRAEELVYPGGELRSDWVFDGMVECRFNRPSLEEGWRKQEAIVFAEVIARCPAKIPSWQQELEVAREPLRQRAGDLAAQLELFSDPSFDGCAGYQFLEQLRLETGVSEDTMADFAEAGRKVALQVRLLQRYPELVDVFSDTRVSEALETFEKAKSDLLARASSTRAPDSQQPRRPPADTKRD
jgi:hypothetical protein